MTIVVPRYRIASPLFRRGESVGTYRMRTGDAVDPTWIKVIVVGVDDVSVNSSFERTPIGVSRTDPLRHGVAGGAVIQSVETFLGEVNDKLRRLQTGVWIFELDPARYQPGRAYEILWRYQITPGVDNVTRNFFVWQPPPAQPQDPDGVVIYGVITDTDGAPVPDTVVVIEQFESIHAVSNRVSAVDVTTDPFGMWWVEVKQSGVYRIVVGDVAKIIQGPSVRRAFSLNEIPQIQPLSTIVKDQFGYPILGDPGISYLAEAEVRVIIDRLTTLLRQASTGQDVSVGGLRYVVYTQSSPASTWTIRHNSSCQPLISVLNSDGTLMIGDVDVSQPNVVTVSFNMPVTGKAVLLLGPQTSL